MKLSFLKFLLSLLQNCATWLRISATAATFYQLSLMMAFSLHTKIIEFAIIVLQYSFTGEWLLQSETDESDNAVFYKHDKNMFIFRDLSGSNCILRNEVQNKIIRIITQNIQPTQETEVLILNLKQNSFCS